MLPLKFAFPILQIGHKLLHLFHFTLRDEADFVIEAWQFFVSLWASQASSRDHGNPSTVGGLLQRVCKKLFSGFLFTVFEGHLDFFSVLSLIWFMSQICIYFSDRYMRIVLRLSRWFSWHSKRAYCSWGTSWSAKLCKYSVFLGGNWWMIENILVGQFDIREQSRLKLAWKIVLYAWMCDTLKKVQISWIEQ